MKHRIKMVGLDLDGTLLTDRKEITPRTRKVISQAIAEGIVVLVATGVKVDKEIPALNRDAFGQRIVKAVCVLRFISLRGKHSGNPLGCYRCFGSSCELRYKKNGKHGKSGEKRCPCKDESDFAP